MNVHKRCHRNVANNCGVNAKEMAQILKDMGLTGNKLTESMRIKKVGKCRAVMCPDYPLHFSNLIARPLKYSLTLCTDHMWAKKGGQINRVIK